MFILVFGPSMGYATFGSIYTQVIWVLLHILIELIFTNLHSLKPTSATQTLNWDSCFRSILCRTSLPSLSLGFLWIGWEWRHVVSYARRSLLLAILSLWGRVSFFLCWGEPYMGLALNVYQVGTVPSNYFIFVPSSLLPVSHIWIQYKLYRMHWLRDGFQKTSKWHYLCPPPYAKYLIGNTLAHNTHSLAHSPSFKYSASSFLSMGTTPLIYSYYGFEAVLLFTCGVVIVSAIAAVLLVGIDRTYEEYLSGDSESESFEWGNMLHLGPVFWMLVVATCAFYFSVLPFISFSNEFLIDKWQVSEEEAGIMTGT